MIGQMYSRSVRVEIEKKDLYSKRKEANETPLINLFKNARCNIQLFVSCAIK